MNEIMNEPMNEPMHEPMNAIPQTAHEVARAYEAATDEAATADDVATSEVVSTDVAPSNAVPNAEVTTSAAAPATAEVTTSAAAPATAEVTTSAAAPATAEVTTSETTPDDDAATSEAVRAYEATWRGVAPETNSGHVKSLSEGLRLRMKIWTDRATSKRYLMPSAFMRDVVNGQPVSEVMYTYAMRDDDTKLVTLTAREWNALPFFYFREDGPAPRATTRPVDVVVSRGRTP
jgi:hypothetical protein